MYLSPRSFPHRGITWCTQKLPRAARKAGAYPRNHGVATQKNHATPRIGFFADIQCSIKLLWNIYASIVDEFVVIMQ